MCLNMTLIRTLPVLLLLIYKLYLDYIKLADHHPMDILLVWRTHLVGAIHFQTVLFLSM